MYYYQPMDVHAAIIKPKAVGSIWIINLGGISTPIRRSDEVLYQHSFCAAFYIHGACMKRVVIDITD
jgi:hypothetical protein